MRRITVSTLTIAILVVYGLTLKWSIDSGQWWWVFPLGICATIIGYFWLTDKDERVRGNKEIADSFRRLISRNTPQ